MLELAVIGDPIDHSLSPIIHRLFAQQCGLSIHYQKLRVEQDNLADFLMKAQDRLDGINITAPHKEAAYKYLAEQGFTASNTCAKIAAINTVDFRQQSVFNTDGYGFANDLVLKQVSITDKTVVLVGAGGATKGIVDDILTMRPKNLFLLNRSVVNAQKIQALFPNIQIIHSLTDWVDYDVDWVVNATSAHDGFEQILPLQNFGNLFKHASFYDLSYRLNEPTPFLKFVSRVRKNNFQCDGRGMLINQAARSFQIWTGEVVDVSNVLTSLMFHVKH